MTVAYIGMATTIATVTQDFFTDEGNDLLRMPDGTYAFAFTTADNTMSGELGTLRTMTLDSSGAASSGVTVLQQDYAGYVNGVDLQYSLSGDYFAVWAGESDTTVDGRQSAIDGRSRTHRVAAGHDHRRWHGRPHGLEFHPAQSCT